MLHVGAKYSVSLACPLIISLNPVQEGAMDDGSDDDGESGEEGAEDPNSAPHTGFLSSTWSFIITFFMSLIPEGPPNAAN